MRFQSQTKNSHIGLTIARVDNGKTGVAHRPALGTVDTTRGLISVGTTMVQDFGSIGQGGAGLGQDRRTAGVDAGSGVPHVTVLCFGEEVGSGGECMIVKKKRMHTIVSATKAIQG